MPAVSKSQNNKSPPKTKKLSVAPGEKRKEPALPTSAKETKLTIDSLKQKRINPFSCLLFTTKSIDVPFTKELETFLTVRKKEMNRFKFSLKSEMNFLQRTLYKIRNAHKSTIHFQKLKEVNRSVKLLNQLLISYIPPIIESYEQLESFEIAYRSARRPKTARGMPPKTLIKALWILHGFIYVCNKVKSSCKKAGTACMELLSLRFFVPLATVSISIVSRIFTFALHLSIPSVRLYNALYPCADQQLLMQPLSPQMQKICELIGALPPSEQLDKLAIPLTADSSSIPRKTAREDLATTALKLASVEKAAGEQKAAASQSNIQSAVPTAKQQKDKTGKAVKTTKATSTKANKANKAKQQQPQAQPPASKEDIFNFLLGQ